MFSGKSLPDSPNVIRTAAAGLLILFLFGCSFDPAYEPWSRRAENKFRRSPRSVDIVPEKPERGEGDVSMNVIEKQRELSGYVKKNFPVKEVLWEYTLEGADFVNVWQGPQNVYAETKNYQLWAIDRETGNPRWKYALNGRLDYGPVFVKGVPSQKKEIVRVIEDIQSKIASERGEPNPDYDRINRLQIRLDEQKVTRQSLVKHDRIYLVIGTELIAIDREFGTQIMRRHLDFAPSAPPYATRSLVVVPGFKDFTVHFLDPATLWEQEKFAPMGLVSAQANYSEPIYLFPSADGNLYAYEGNGSLTWNLHTGGKILGRPAVWKKSIFIGSEDMQFYAVDQTSGNVRWTQQLGVEITETADVSPPNVYVRAEDGFYYSFDLASGKLQWSIKGPKDFLLRAEPRIYAVNRDKKTIYAIHDDNGEILNTYSYKPFDFVLRNKKESIFFFATRDGTILAAQESEIGS